MEKRVFVFLSLALMIGCLGVAKEAQATTLDLTTAGSSGSIGGAFFQQTNFEQSSTGTGVINSFVRIQDDIEEGYNTDGRPLPLWPDVNTSPTFTHSLLLSVVPIVSLSGTDYREFLLDINQTAPGTLLSLDKLMIFQESDPDLTGSLASLGTPLYDLDAGGDNWIKLNYILNPGSGKGDVLVYIPNSLFNPSGGQYVYLYSRLGDNFTGNDGFEEWAICQQVGGCGGGGTTNPPIPEPMSMLLVGSGLLGVLGLKGRKK